MYLKGFVVVECVDGEWKCLSVIEYYDGIMKCALNFQCTM